MGSSPPVLAHVAQIFEIGLAELDVVGRIGEPVGIALDAAPADQVAGGAGADLHQPARAGRADRVGPEVRFLERVGEGQSAGSTRQPRAGRQLGVG